MNAMKQRPILFSGAMVRAILSGVKTQTRRIVKLRNGDLPSDGDVATFEDGSFHHFMDFSRAFPQWEPLPCPYGEPGDRLWVRETYFEAKKWRHAPVFAAAPDFIYRADYEYREELSSVIGCHHWKPSIFMPREASRITLEILSVRVERLNEISETDARAEGIETVQMPTREVMYDDYLESGALLARAVSSYATLWDKINGGGAWSTNPWVWVVEFQRVGGAV